MKLTYKHLIASSIVCTSLLLQGCAALMFGAVGGAALVGNDRRPADTMLGDERVEIQIKSRFRQELPPDHNVDVLSYNRVVLLTGTVKTAAQKAQAERVASEVPGVRGVNNEVIVGGYDSTPCNGDAFLTTQVKARLVGAKLVSPVHVKVTTESCVVYLMGLVTKAEADEAARIAASTQGAKRVVRIFEYIAEPSTPAPNS